MPKSSDLPRDNRSIRQQSVRMNKELIMDTAARLFAETSYDAVSLDDVAGKIGATKGLIYHYFHSKSALLGELLLWHFELFMENINSAWELPANSPSEKLKNVINAHIDFNFKYNYVITVVYRTSYLVPPDMRRKLKKQRMNYTQKLQSLIAEAQETGGLVEGNAEILNACITTLVSYLPYVFRDDENSRRPELHDVVNNLFFHDKR